MVVVAQKDQDPNTTSTASTSSPVPHNPGVVGTKKPKSSSILLDVDQGRIRGSTVSTSNSLNKHSISAQNLPATTTAKDKEKSKLRSLRRFFTGKGSSSSNSTPSSKPDVEVRTLSSSKPKSLEELIAEDCQPESTNGTGNGHGCVGESLGLQTKSVSEINLRELSPLRGLNKQLLINGALDEEEDKNDFEDSVVSVQEAVAAIENLGRSQPTTPPIKTPRATKSPTGGKMGNSCSYKVKQLPPATANGGMDAATFGSDSPIHEDQDFEPIGNFEIDDIGTSIGDLSKELMVLHANKMADTEELGCQTGLNGQTMGLLNGVQSTGNVQSKAAAFQRSSQSHAQTVNSRRVVSSSLSSHHQTNETSQHVSKQSSTQHVKQNLSEMQTRMSQMQALSTKTESQSSTSSSSSTLKSSISPLKIMDAKNNAMNGSDSPLETGTVLVTEVPFPTPTDMQLAPLGDISNTPLESPNLVMNNVPNSAVAPDGTQSFRFEQKKVASSSSTKVRSGNFSSEQSSANAAEMKRVQTGDVKYEEKQSAQAIRQKVEVDGVTAEKSAALKQQQRSITQGGVTEEETRTAAAAAMKLSTSEFTAEKRAVAGEQRKQTLSGQNVINSERHVTAASQARLTIKNNLALPPFDSVVIFEDLDSLGWESSNTDVDKVTSKYSGELLEIANELLASERDKTNPVSHLNYASGVMKAAWKVPGHGHQVGINLCDTFRKAGGIDVIISNFNSNQKDLRVASAKLLEAALTPDNCNYVVEKGFGCLDQVVKVASELCEMEESPVGIGLLGHLFRHSEATCSDVIRLRGLEKVIAESRRMDVETLRNCAAALVNLSLYGGAENQEAMIKKKVHIWLFPLAFHPDDVIKYNACLAIAALLANKEIEAEIIKSNTLELVDPFLIRHNPVEFAQTSLHQGQSSQWLAKLVPVLSSQREEACSIAAFHFCMEAGIKKREGKTAVFKQINAIEPLKRVASSPNALASKFAAQALRIIGETVPHKLSQQVPLWSIEDVREWVIQKGFDKHSESFMTSRVDGDLLLQLTEDMLKTDIGMDNGILRKRFMRDLKHLKKMTDYSSCDPSYVNDFLNAIHPDFCAYTYTLINNHVDRETLRKCVSEDGLEECGVASSIHRKRIMEALKAENSVIEKSEDNPDKPLDVFISYRRSNGSQLASLLKVHLQLRGFSVFIDVERLEAGKFDSNLLQSIRQARHFLLVLTPNALDRCVQDIDCKDWVHREIVAALESQCNIIPIMDNFSFPETDHLPEDIQPVLTFNGVKWIHDYQDACVDKLERFLKGESVTDTIQARDREQQTLGPCTIATRPSHQYQRTSSIGSEGNRLE